MPTSGLLRSGLGRASASAGWRCGCGCGCGCGASAGRRRAGAGAVGFARPFPFPLSFELRALRAFPGSVSVIRNMARVKGLWDPWRNALGRPWSWVAPDLPAGLAMSRKHRGRSRRSAWSRRRSRRGHACVPAWLSGSASESLEAPGRRPMAGTESASAAVNRRRFARPRRRHGSGGVAGKPARTPAAHHPRPAELAGISTVAQRPPRSAPAAPYALTTLETTARLGGSANTGTYRRLVSGPGWPLVVRKDRPLRPGAGRQDRVPARVLRTVHRPPSRRRTEPAAHRVPALAPRRGGAGGADGGRGLVALVQQANALEGRTPGCALPS